MALSQRNRRRTDLRQLGFWSTTYVASNGSTSVSSGSELALDSYFTKFHSFWDWTGDASRVKPASQMRVDMVKRITTVPFKDEFNGWHYPTQGNVMSRITVPPFSALTILERSPSTVQVLHDGAFTSFFTQMPEVVSIGNFLYELREFGTLFPRLRDSLAGHASGNFLRWEFGWKPFLSDLQKLSDLTTSVERRLKFLRETYGKTVRLGYEKEIVYPHTLPYDAGKFEPAWNWSYHRRVTEYRGVYRAGGYLYHRLNVTDDLAMVKAMTAALGLNNPAKVLWNSIPFSFVLDWFLKFGSLLDRLAKNPFEGTWHVKRVTHSTEEWLRVAIDQQFNAAQNVRTNWVGEYVVSRYVRGVGLPAGVHFLDASQDPKKQLLALALIHQSTR